MLLYDSISSINYIARYRDIKDTTSVLLLIVRLDALLLKSRACVLDKYNNII